MLRDSSKYMNYILYGSLLLVTSKEFHFRDNSIFLKIDKNKIIIFPQNGQPGQNIKIKTNYCYKNNRNTGENLLDCKEFVCYEGF